MSPIVRRRVAVAQIVMLCAAVFTLTWVGGWLLSLFLLAVGVVIFVAGYLVWRLLPTTETDADRMAREAVKRSGVHPAGRGRVTDSAEAAWLDNPVVIREANPERITAEPMDPVLRDLAREWSKRRGPANRELTNALREFNHGVISR